MHKKTPRTSSERKGICRQICEQPAKTRKKSRLVLRSTRGFLRFRASVTFCHLRKFQKRRRGRSKVPSSSGAGERTRTPDLRITNARVKCLFVALLSGIFLGFDTHLTPIQKIVEFVDIFLLVIFIQMCVYIQCIQHPKRSHKSNSSIKPRNQAVSSSLSTTRYFLCGSGFSSNL